MDRIDPRNESGVTTLESLRAEFADIEKKLSKEKQLNRKYELAKEKQRLRREVGNVTT